MHRFGVIICAIIVVGVHALQPHRAEATGDTAAELPNIVLIVSDDQTMDSLAAMPFLTSKPGGHWIEFTNAFLNTPWCCPTRATLLTGLYSHHHGVVESNGANFDESSTTATWLQSAGYRTGLAGKYLNDYPYKRPPYIPVGWSDWSANVGRTSHFNHTMYDNGTLITYGNAPSDYQTDVVARRADTFIRSSAGQPFFFYAAPVAPHHPYTVPPRYANAPVSFTHSPNFNEADVSDKPAWVKANPLLAPAQIASLDNQRASSFRMVMAVDDLVRTVYQALQDTGALDNTVIVFTTDNGLMFGEHRSTGKVCAYEECIANPLFMRVPWASGGLEPRLVSSIDIAPTIADVAGLVPPTPVDGTSLMGLTTGETTSWRSSLLHEFAGTSEKPHFWAIRTAEWKYIELETEEKELYDLVNDPYELENRAGQSAWAEMQADLDAQLEALKVAPPVQVKPALSISDASVVEGTSSSGVAAFTVSLSDPSQQTITVHASTSDGTAIAPDDYQSADTTLTFVPGQLEATLSIGIEGDSVEEPEETFLVTLDQPQNAVVADGEATGTILDDDEPATPALSIDDVEVVEGDGLDVSAVFAVSLTPTASEPVAVSYETADGSATAPDDYAAASGTLVFDPGEGSKTIAILIVGDDLVEGLESFTVVLSNPSGAPIGDGVGLGSIVDDDVVTTASVGDVAVTEGNSGASSASFVVSLTAATPQPVSISYQTVDGTAVAPGDYLSASGSVMFQPGETSKTVSVSISGDSTFEASEVFYLDISSTDVPVTDGRGEATITNDDVPPSLMISDVTITEGTGAPVVATFLVTMSAPSGLPANVSYQTANGSALAPADYQMASGVLSFAPGETSEIVEVVVVGDSLRERSERFFVTLSSASGATIADGSGRCMILDDD
jgi:arylsulfatase A-like enzyme